MNKGRWVPIWPNGRCWKFVVPDAPPLQAEPRVWWNGVRESWTGMGTDALKARFDTPQEAAVWALGDGCKR